MREDIRRFYDELSPHLVHDYVQGNRRVERQLRFFSDAIPRNAEKILVVGCGSGESANYLARQAAPNARILAVDISAENIRAAGALFRHDRVVYRKLDITSDQVEGRWEVIALPDVYEHVALAHRTVLHDKLATLLTERGRLVLTLPSPYHQAALAAAGTGLQIVDEVVTLDDLLAFASDVQGTLTYFNLISVWNVNDYIHAVIERQAGRYTALTATDRLPVKGWRPKPLARRGGDFVASHLRLDSLPRWARRRRVQKRLRSVQASSED